MRYLIFVTAVFILLLNTAHGVFRDNFILVGDSGNRTTGLYQINIGTGETVQLLPEIPRSVVAVAYDPREQEFFYSDIVRHAIVRYSARNGQEELLHQTFDKDSHIDGMVLDHVNRKLYFADSPMTQIFGLVTVHLPGIVGVIDLETNAKTILLRHDTIRPRALQLDLENMNLYFTDWDENDPGIFVLTLNSNNVTAKRIVSTNLYWPNGLAIDSKGRKMYFADVRPAPNPSRVEVANLDGSGRRTLLEEHGVHYYGLALDANFIYLTGWNNKKIRRIDRSTNRISNVESTQSFGKLFGISVYVAANEPQVAQREISRSTTVISTTSTTTTPTMTTTPTTTTTTQSTSTSAESITSSSSSIKVLYQTEGNVSPAIAEGNSQNLQNVLQQFINNPVILVSIAVVVVAVIISATVCCVVRRKRSNNSPIHSLARPRAILGQTDSSKIYDDDDYDRIPSVHFYSSPKECSVYLKPSENKERDENIYELPKEYSQYTRLNDVTENPEKNLLDL